MRKNRAGSPGRIRRGLLLGLPARCEKLAFQSPPDEAVRRLNNVQTRITYKNRREEIILLT
ncbi:MAG: hypothetical protein CEE38_22045 [Planctomycetes bacterium B3_Pla]|nr:MAG: hypothetical protein CEE38_22045 [Planctomycetes bacterium B3_Pla]